MNFRRFMPALRAHFSSQQRTFTHGDVRVVPLKRHSHRSNGIDALTISHDPVKLFRWNKSMKQRGLTTKSFLLCRENTLKRTPDINGSGSPTRFQRNEPTIQI
jgi:hypothetical protein